MSIDLRKGIVFHHHHVSLALVVLVFMIIIIVLLVKPAFIGYKLSNEFESLGSSAGEFLRQMDLLKSEKLVVETNLENCKKTNADYLQQVTDEKSATFSCIEEKNELESKLEQQKKECDFNLNNAISENEQKKSAAELELEQLKVQFAGVKSSYGNLAKSSANNICCKNKIDNPEIDSYSVSGDRIVCTVGAENKISC